MAKPRATAQNAVTHGIFQQDLPPASPSPFASLAMQTLPGPLGAEMADDLMRIEAQTTRCRAALLQESRAIEALLTAARQQGADPTAQIDPALNTAISQLTRLLRYQNQSLTALRKTRIAILNAAEGFGSQRGTPRE